MLDSILQPESDCERARMSIEETVTAVNPMFDSNSADAEKTTSVSVLTISSVQLSIDRVEDEDDNEGDSEMNEMLFTLPPIVSANNTGKVVPHSKLWLVAQIVDVVSINVGSIFFIVGSVYFYPSSAGDCSNMGISNCELVGADLFIIGSYLFLQGTVIVFFQTGAYKLENIPLLINLIMYMVANVMFVVGSFFFIPDVATEYGPYIGIWLFIIGSFIFVVSPCYNLYRATDMLNKRLLSPTQHMVTAIMCTLYIVGSLAFVIGSVLFLPNYYESYAVTIFVWGSVAFLIATLLTPLKYSWRVASKKTRQSLHNRDSKLFQA